MRRLRVLPLIVALMLVASACGGPSGASSPPAGTSAPSSSVASPADAATVTIAMPVVSSFRQVDPHDAAGSQTGLLNNIYEQLTTLDPSTFQVVPSLAEEWESDGNTYTFSLRQGVEFHGGGEMTSADVQLSFERMIAINKAFGVSNLAVIEEIATPDEYTIAFTVSPGGPPFEKVVSQVAIVNSAAVEEHTVGEDNASAWFRENADGTGPYALEQWIAGDRFVLTRHENYWGAAPYYQTAIVLDVPEANTQALMVQRGEVDVALRVPPTLVPQLEQDVSLQVLRNPGPYNTILPLLAFGNAPTADVHVRRAIAYAMNYDELYSTRTEFVRSEGPVPSIFIDGFVSENLPTFDLAKAQEELSMSAYPDGGFTLTLVGVTTLPEQQTALEILQAGLATLNITLDIQIRDFVPVYQDFLTWKEEADPDVERPIQGMFIGIPPFVADPHNYLSSYLCDSALNFAAYCNDEVDSLVLEGSTAATVEERNGLYEQAIELIVEDVPALQIGLDQEVGVARSEIQGFELSYLWHPYGIDIWRLSE